MTIDQCKCDPECDDLGEEDGKPVCNKYDMWLNRSKPSGTYIMKCGECINDKKNSEEGINGVNE